MTEKKPVTIRKWSQKEECVLLEQIRDNKTDEEIAELHERSVGAIVIRRKKLALEMFKDGKDYEHILKVTRVTEDEINQQKKYNEKKTGDDTKKLQMIKKELERLLACL